MLSDNAYGGLVPHHNHSSPRPSPGSGGRGVAVAAALGATAWVGLVWLAVNFANSAIRSGGAAWIWLAVCATAAMVAAFIAIFYGAQVLAHARGEAPAPKPTGGGKRAKR